MKRNVINLENFKKNELSDNLKKVIKGGNPPKGSTTDPKTDGDGEPVTSGNNGDGTRNDSFPVIPGTTTATS